MPHLINFFQILKFKWIQLVIIIIFSSCSLLYACVSWYRIVSTTAPDFTVYYAASERIWQKKKLYGEQFAFTGYGYPPQTALLYSPFILMPYTVAQTLWITISFISIPIISLFIYRLFISKHIVSRKTFFLQQYPFLFVCSSLIFLSFATKFTIGMGQVNIVALTLFLFVCWLEKKGYSSAAGILFAICLLLKPQLSFFFLLLLLYKKFWLVLWAAITGIGITIMTFFIGGKDLLITYIFEEIPSLNRFVGRDVYYNQSIGSILTRVTPERFAQSASSIIGLFLLIVTSIYLFKNRTSFLFSLIFFIPVFLLAEPVAWQHHYVFLLPTLVVLGIYSRRKFLTFLTFCSYILISINIPFPALIHPSFFNKFIILSHGFWGGVIAYGVSLYMIAKKRSVSNPLHE